MVSPQPSERGVDGIMDVLGAVAARVRMIAGPEAGLGGDDDAVAQGPVGDELADQTLALAPRIDVGGIDEVAARLDIGVEDGARSVRVGAPALRAEGHGAERHRADHKAGAAESAEVCKGH